jgi:putative ABC transport system permease protein
MLLAAALLVLLAACVNVTNLMLTRQVARAREAAIRRALGASSGRLIADRLAESVLLAAGGGALGVALAVSLIEILVRLGPASGLPRLDAVKVDGPVLLFSVALAGVSALVTSLMPAFRSANPADTLRSGATYAATPALGRRIRGALCVTELAVSLVLLVGVGLLGRSLMRLLQTDLGVTAERVATASLNLAFGGRPPDAQVLDRIDRVIERVAALPGVEAAGVGTSLPPARSRIRLTLRLAGDAVGYQASAVAATPGYFDALGFRLVKGRLFTPQDDLDHPHVMIMSVDTARRFFGDGDPIGRTMSLPILRNGVTKSEETTLVGVVANVRYGGLAMAPDDAVYRPFAQQPWVAPFLVARTARAPEGLLSVIRREIAAVDQAIVVADVRPLDALVSDETTQPRFRTALLAGIAGLAMLVGAVGLFGVVAQSVSQRTREIGIRIALGAGRNEIRRMVLREGAWLGLSGVVLGVPAAFVAARTLRGLLYGVEPADVLSFVLASAALLTVSLAATYIPAARAARVDPLVALRSE